MITTVGAGYYPSRSTQNTASAAQSTAQTADPRQAGKTGAGGAEAKSNELVVNPGRNSVRDYSAVQQNLAKGKGAVETALSASKDVKVALAQVKDVATKLADEKLSGGDREKLQKQYSELRTGIQKTLESANYKGADGGKGVNLLTDKENSKITVNTYGGQAELRSSKLDSSLGLPEKIGSAADAKALLDGKDGKTSVLKTAQTAVSESTDRLSREDKKLKEQLDTATAVRQSAEGLENARNGTRSPKTTSFDEESRAALLRQASETRQQLKLQGLGIGNPNQGARSLLSLFS